MIKEIRYTSIKRVLDDVTDHPMLRGVTLEQVVRHTIRFISLFGMPGLFQDRLAKVDIHEFRGVLPCDLVSITQVKDMRTGICLRHMTDSFIPAQEHDLHESGHAPHHHRHPCGLPHPHGHDGHGGPRRPNPDIGDLYSIHPQAAGMDRLPHPRCWHGVPAFKTQGRVIYTTFPEGCLEISYRAVPADEDGYPMIIDNEVYLAALEAYIKKQVFTVKFDTGKIAANVLEQAKQDYAWLAAELQDEFTVPSYAEAQAIMNCLNTMILNTTSFYRGFRDAGDMERIRRH